MIDNRCPSCRWRVMHERPVACIEGVGTSKFPCCHGGPPVTIHGDFPFCPEPPYDYCRAFDRVLFRVGQTWNRDRSEDSVVVLSVEGQAVCFRRSDGKTVRGTDEELLREITAHGWFPGPDSGDVR